MRNRPAQISMCIFQSSVVLCTTCAEAWQRTPGRERRSAHFQDAQVSANCRCQREQLRLEPRGHQSSLCCGVGRCSERPRRSSRADYHLVKAEGEVEQTSDTSGDEKGWGMACLCNTDVLDSTSRVQGFLVEGVCDCTPHIYSMT